MNARENFHNSMYADYELELAGDDPPCPSYWTTLYDNQYSYDNTTLNIPTDIAYKKFIVDFLNMRLDYLIEGLEDYIPYNVNIIADEYAAESGDSLMRQVNCLLIKAAFDMLNDICTDQTLSFDECYSCETTDQFVNVVPRTEQHPWAIPKTILNIIIIPICLILIIPHSIKMKTDLPLMNGYSFQKING